MGYKNENIKHLQGISDEPKYRCPNCKKGLAINKIPFMMVCSRCKKSFKGGEIIIKEE